MFERIIVRSLSDGSTRRLFPFHICLKGLPDIILCRDDEDFDVFVKQIHLCAIRKNVVVVVYIVMSNHLHVMILAPDQKAADEYCVEIKKTLSMYYSRRYGVRKVLRHLDASAFYLDTNSYVRNSIAYTLKNSLDAGCRVDQYPWSSFRAVFASGKSPDLVPVSRLSTREVERVFHTNMDISSTGWLIDGCGRLDPSSACYVLYAEEAFNNDLSFFWRVLGMVDNPAMEARFVDGPRTRLNDQQFLKYLSETAERWFGKKVDDLSNDNKMRLVPYIYHTVRTSPSQLARGLGLDRALIEKLIRYRRQ